ncbi:TBC1 domain family member 15 isoform X1 [Brienomyrus brachyistius]|uniref:TBC1 domain family member 15 isoform X1 n=1 Tax=Brienomyrus brachyistius TaxID=42636 RepID=UPI0020B3E131|nr:TBC1 domain family member 15 isoform X1 [Brienomyrus brachyistius]
MAAAVKVIFEQDGIFIHPGADSSEFQDSLTSGFLRILDKDGEILVEYKPLEDSSNMLCAGKDSSSVVQWAQCPGDRRHRSVEQQQSYETEWDMVNTVSFKKKPSANGEALSSPAPERTRGAFLFNVSDLKTIKVKTEGWSRLIFCLKEDVTLPDLHFHQGGSDAFLDSLGGYLLLTQSPGDRSILVVSSQSKALSQSFENLLDDATFGLVQKFKNDPYTTTLGGFSKVTNYIFDAFRGPEMAHRQRPAEEVADLISEAMPGLEVNQQEEPGFEVITRIDLGPRPAVWRGEPVSAEAWAEHMDAEGRVQNVAQLKEAVFKGGLCHAARREGWKFLLGYLPWDTTREERKGLQKRKTDEYFRMKLQWKSVSEEQERRNSRLRDYRSLIEKDVNRTDRTNKFYEGPDNPGLILLHDILMTYCMYDFDLGYVQGMSDLLSPILYVMENEVDAFWCFVSFMDQMHQNFEEQMQGMKTQLIHLSTLLRLLDQSFWNYLESQDSGYLYFCFRWLLIRFKRELSFQGVLRLWEVMWTGLPCQNFHLLVCCAILDSEKRKIMEENYGFNEILKHINELSMKLDVEEILQKAEAIYRQIESCKDLPSSVGEILGFQADREQPKLDGSEFGLLDSPQPPRRWHTQDLGEDFIPNGNGHLRETHDVYKLAYIL